MFWRKKSKVTQEFYTTFQHLDLMRTRTSRLDDIENGYDIHISRIGLGVLIFECCAFVRRSNIEDEDLQFRDQRRIATAHKAVQLSIGDGP